MDFVSKNVIFLRVNYFIFQSWPAAIGIGYPESWCDTQLSREKTRLIQGSCKIIQQIFTRHFSIVRLEIRVAHRSPRVYMKYLELVVLSESNLALYCLLLFKSLVLF